MRKFTCALVALLAAALFLPTPLVTAASLPERGVVRDAHGDVIGHYEDSATIDIYKVSGWRTGGYLYGRMVVRNARVGHPTQQFVLWVKTRSGKLYLSTARNGHLDEPPTPTNGSNLCPLSSVKFFWGSETDVLLWKMPMSCFKERPAAWLVAGSSSIGRGAAWDQTGGRRPTEFSNAFANTP